MTSDLQGRLLPSLYATPENADHWVGVLDMLCAEMSARNAAVQILERDGDRLRPVWTARDSYSLAHAELHDRHVNNDENPRLDLRLGAWRPKNIVRDSDRFDDRSPALARLRARLAAIGLGASICVTFDLTPERSFSLILHKSLDDRRDFGRATETKLKALLPHLRQTMRLTAAMDEARFGTGALEQALDLIRTGVVLCDSAGNVRWMNRSAEQTIDESPILLLRGGRIGCRRSDDAAALRRALACSSRDDESDSMTVLGEGEDGALQILCAPMERPTGTGGAAPALKAVFLSRPGARLPILPEDLVRLFSLSPAEARLASALAAGASVSSYSKSRGISVGTARIQLKQVLAKTQAAKQVELVRQLCGSVVAQTLPQMH